MQLSSFSILHVVVERYISSPLANVRQTRVLIEFFQKVLLCYNFVPRIFPGSKKLAPATGATRHHGNETSPSYNGEPRSGEMSRSVVFVHWMTSKIGKPATL
jgi:hypothetical protein